MSMSIASVGFVTLIVLLVLVCALVKWVLTLRRVVPLSVVHIVQQAKKTISYGKGQDAGNVYYEWPSWIPVIGITKRVLPVSNFSLDIDSYEAYDADRLPFKIDVKAFFRISNTNEAANKVEDFAELKLHLLGIVQGAVRSILAKSKLEDILSERSIYGQKFTEAVGDQLASWGTECVKALELMDIRDSGDSHVIENIMKKKKSEIEKESRVEVAKNKKLAEQAEIEAEREVQLSEQEAKEKVGIREAEVEKTIGLQKEKTQQEIQEAARITREKEMEVKRVAEVKSAEITKQARIIAAEQAKETLIIDAQARLDAQAKESEQIKIEADAKLHAKQKEAEGIQAEGAAKADAEKEMQMARVVSEIELAKQISDSQSYQEYLVKLEQVRANKEVGIAQAEAMQNAEMKVIANGSTVSEGVSKIGEIFSSKGGQSIASMLEGIMQTDAGRELVEKLLALSKKEKK